MTLCLEAGRLDWKKALSEISTDELQDWIAYESLNGLGPSRDDIRMSQQMTWQMAAKGVETEPKDFLYDVHSQEPEEQPPTDPILTLAAAFGCPPLQRN